MGKGGNVQKRIVNFYNTNLIFKKKKKKKNWGSSRHPLMLALFILISITFFAAISEATKIKSTEALKLRSSSELAWIALNLKITKSFFEKETSGENSLATISKQTALILALHLHNETQESIPVKPKVVSVLTFEDYLKQKYQPEIWAQSSMDDFTIDQLKKLARPTKFTSSKPDVLRRIQSHESKSQYALLYGVPVWLSFTHKVLEDSIKDTFGSNEMIMLRQILVQYYRNLPVSQLSEIAFALSKLPIDAHPADYAAVAILNSGPQLQKMLQVLARKKGIPEGLQVVFSRLESHGNPIPWSKVEPHLKSLGLRFSDFSYFEQKPLGVGTMAQAHRAQFYDRDGNRRSAVVRFLKPGIEKLIEMDHQVMLKVTKAIDDDGVLKKLGLPKLSTLVDDVHASILEELDIRKTVANQIESSSIYHRNLVIHFDRQKNIAELKSPHIYPYKPAPEVMVQELVLGSKPSKELGALKEIYPSLYRVISERLAEVWLEETFFRSGFFHADLHQGNILTQYTDDSVQVQILDFGMVGRLNKQLQRSALLLSIGIQTQNTELIASSFLNLSKRPNRSTRSTTENTAQDKKFESLVQGRLTKIMTKTLEVEVPGQDPNSLDAWTVWALNEGLQLNYEFLKLNRGIQAVQLLLEDANSPLEIQDLALKAAMRNKVFVSKTLISAPEMKVKTYKSLLSQAVAPKKLTLSCEKLF